MGRLTVMSGGVRHRDWISWASGTAPAPPGCCRDDVFRRSGRSAAGQAAFPGKSPVEPGAARPTGDDVVT
ncbi:MAG: hypothetical protein WCE42_13435, partial [Rhizobium ruizarguesonis]